MNKEKKKVEFTLIEFVGLMFLVFIIGSAVILIIGLIVTGLNYNEDCLESTAKTRCEKIGMSLSEVRIYLYDDISYYCTEYENQLNKDATGFKFNKEDCRE